MEEIWGGRRPLQAYWPVPPSAEYGGDLAAEPPSRFPRNLDKLAVGYAGGGGYYLNLEGCVVVVLCEDRQYECVYDIRRSY